MKHYYYLVEDDASSTVIRVLAKTKPSGRGTFPVQEYTLQSSWYYGTWEKVSWSFLKTFKYIGHTTFKA